MEKAVRLLRISCWTGAVIDGLVAIPMLLEAGLGITSPITGYQPTVEYRYAMGIGASLMLGWTALLLYAGREPLHRKGILVITVFPVITGIILAHLYALYAGYFPATVVIAVVILLVSLSALLLYSYNLARRIECK